MPLLAPLLGLIVLSLAMVWAWARQRRTGNAGVVDLLWTASLGLLALVYATLLDGWAPRRVLVAVLAGAWSARLTLHLYQRIRSEAEDGRYAILRERWGTRFQAWMFWFFQAQAVLAWLLSLTFLGLCVAQPEGWRIWDAVGVVIWISSVAGETVADQQLHAWRSNPANKGKTCRSGLWRYSRHPNYFFEWMHWLVYPVLGIGLPVGLALWLTPASMLFLVVKVTGIPPTERQSLRSRGDDYRAYQRETNAFFPGPVKHSDVRILETR